MGLGHDIFASSARLRNVELLSSALSLLCDLRTLKSGSWIIVLGNFPHGTKRLAVQGLELTANPLDTGKVFQKR